jgi:eukaryotic-like serine/threonine-protein kinase
MPAATTCDQFLDLLRKSQLVDSARLDAFTTGLGSHTPNQPRTLAENLVRQGILTPYQAGMLLNGKWRGFFVASGKYKLLQLLGVGGMGKVYLCEHIRLKRLVALKVLTLDPKKDASAVERFSREAVAAANLKSPHIVRAHDIDQDGALHYFVMEYVDGSSLQEIVKKHGPLEIPRACHYISQAAVGLQHAHEAGWVHRDIKPGNLLLDRAGTVKILDMGLARFFYEPGEGITQQLDNNAVLGTADYLAPEQATNSHEVDIRADIYSLGATFYFLLTGQTPFPTGTTAEKLLAHQMQDPVSVTKLRSEIPPPLETIIKKMMSKKPVHRYQTPIAVVEALAEWTTTPIERPADEEMPRICTALESYISSNGTPSVAPSTITHPSSNHLNVQRPTPYSSSYILRNGTPSASRLLAKARQKPMFLVAGICAIALVMGITIWYWPTSKSKTPAPTRPTETAQQKPAEKPPKFEPQPPSQPKPTQPGPGAISPMEAAKKVGEVVTVEYVVNSTGETRDKSRIFLNSTNYREKNNFTVVLDMKKLDGPFRTASIDDPKKHFQGKTIRVSGKVGLYQDAPQLEIEDLKQIEIVSH